MVACGFVVWLQWFNRHGKVKAVVAILFECIVLQDVEQK